MTEKAVPCLKGALSGDGTCERFYYNTRREGEAYDGHTDGDRTHKNFRSIYYTS